MHVEIWQLVLIVLYGFFINYEKNSTMCGTYQPVTCGFVVGLILGDVKTGLTVGGTLQLMSLGISNFGGASVPDYQTATIVGAFVTISTAQTPEIGITIGIPVALFMVQLDVIRNTIGIWLVHQAEHFMEKRDYRKIEWMQYIGLFITMATTGIPVLLAVAFGPELVKTILNYTPEWLIGGLSVAGGLLPAVGVGLLLRYLPVKDYFSFLIIGFLLAVYLKVAILGVALAGAAIALLIYKKEANAPEMTVAGNGGMNDDE